MKKLVIKAWLMIILIVMIPLTMPVVFAGDDDDDDSSFIGGKSIGEDIVDEIWGEGEGENKEIPGIEGSDISSLPTADQICYYKVQKGEEFLDFMDNDIINALEIISTLLYSFSSLINTVDYFITLTSSVIGMIGSDLSACCVPAVSGIGGTVCAGQWAAFKGWKGIKNSNPVIQGIVDFTTCACCTSDATPGMKALAGGSLLICPLGNIANMFGSSVGDPSAGGIGKFHLNAFDNIYMAVGCLCPVAILHNLKKLKVIYQTYNCCVLQACENGISTESCERQFDEASCMYWEGAGIKSLIAIVASIASQFIAKMIMDWVGDNMLVACILMVIDLSKIPAKITSLIQTFETLTTTFEDQKCSDLGFEDIEDQLESGYMKSKTGEKYILEDSNRDSVMDTVSKSYSST
jgi:hypothetical protein